MKRFLSAVALCVCLLVFGLFVFLPTTKAEKSLLESLLSLPAPPPSNPLVVSVPRSDANVAFSRDKPPADDAATADLVAYWQQINNYSQKFTYTPDPSDQTVGRLIEEVENNPEKLPSLMNAFNGKPNGIETVKRLYERELSDKKYEREWRDSVKRWLTYNSNSFSSDLLKVAEDARDANEYVTNQDEVLALARVDWDKARPLLDKMMNDATQPVSQTLARWAFYEHAVREKNSIDADRYRKMLQETVETKTNKPGNRDLAMDALVEGGDFDGRDDWYFSLLEDETLHDLRAGGTTFTGLTTILNHSPSDKYVAKMIELSRSSNQTIRSAAVRNLATLIDDNHREVIEALLPWLENPTWAKENGYERRQLISALRQFEIPDSVPGLIAVLNEKQQREVDSSTYTGNVMMNANRAMPRGTVDYYPFRDEAIGALAKQKDPRAVPALRAVLPQVEEWARQTVVQTILVSRGFTVGEQIEALEAVARLNGAMNNGMSNTNSMPVNANMYSGAISETRIEVMASNLGSYIAPNRPLDATTLKLLLGQQLSNQQDAEEDLVTALIDRINFLDKKEPVVANSLRRIMQNWNGAAVNRLMLRDLKNDRATTESVVKLLSLRKELREKQWSDVSDVQNGTATAFGIGACLLEDGNSYDSILTSDNAEAKAALFACARLIRAALPVQSVAANLKSPNKTLAAAAESYLAVEDSPEARQIVLSLHPNQALILGARTYFGVDGNSDLYNSLYLPALFASVNNTAPGANYYIYGGDNSDLDETEQKLRDEVKTNQELLGVYSYDNNFVRIYRDKAVFSWQEDKARYRERELDKSEFGNLTEFLSDERVNELPPFLSACENECEAKELLMLSRQGGRRVFNLSEPQPKFFAALDRLFGDMRQPPAKLHYWLEKNITGLDILFENPNLQAEAVWKVGDDFRVLINNQARRKEIDKEIEQQDEADEERLASTETDEEDYSRYEKMETVKRERRERRAYENYAWQKLAGNQLAGIVQQPDNFEFLPRLDGTAIPATTSQWKARTATFEIRANSEGLYKVSGGRVTKLREGYYDQPVITANGRWLLVTHYDEEAGRQFLRINLQTNKQFIVNFEEHPMIESVAFVPSLNKVLLFGGEYNEYDEYDGGELSYKDRQGEFYLLDADTGVIQKAKGEVNPLAQQTYRQLQSNGKPDEFWAAIPDNANSTRVGVYNAKTLQFQQIVRLPQISFDSMQMWVDAGKLYFVYEGHLLSLPLSKETTITK